MFTDMVGLNAGSRGEEGLELVGGERRAVCSELAFRSSGDGRRVLDLEVVFVLNCFIVYETSPQDAQDRGTEEQWVLGVKMDKDWSVPGETVKQVNCLLLQTFNHVAG